MSVDTNINTNINVKNLTELTIEERREINELILSNFKKSRLNTYENIYYYNDNTNNKNKIIGVVGVYFINKYLSLNQLCIDKDYRKKGLATSLLSYIIDEYKNSSIILYIDKNKENTEYLYNFYLRRGFKEISYLKTFNLTYERDKEILMILENTAFIS
jgi:N-acetylglutamate synthase-like GNAT family acetyltransferase